MDGSGSPGQVPVPLRSLRPKPSHERARSDPPRSSRDSSENDEESEDDRDVFLDDPLDGTAGRDSVPLLPKVIMHVHQFKV
jgi:hypothetical protein